MNLSVELLRSSLLGGVVFPVLHYRLHGVIHIKVLRTWIRERLHLSIETDRRCEFW
ncbi:MAG: hypothetical protein LBL39_04565 [Planctomycetaceae bacterium]|nr:hypothetical protein [Planctomycetaceae bacterium]